MDVLKLVIENLPFVLTTALVVGWLVGLALTDGRPPKKLAKVGN